MKRRYTQLSTKVYYFNFLTIITLIILFIHQIQLRPFDNHDDNVSKTPVGRSDRFLSDDDDVVGTACRDQLV